MFLLFGIGKQTIKRYGKTPEERCVHCKKSAPRYFVSVTSWFTVFFIPLIPYSMKYMLICPICNEARTVGREELDEIVENLQPMDAADPIYPSWPEEGDAEPDQGEGEFKTIPGKPGADRFSGKNPTQKAYLEKLEAHEKAMEERRATEEIGANTDTNLGEWPEGNDLEAWFRGFEAREKALAARAKDLEARVSALEARLRSHE